MISQKTCRTCGDSKALDDFHRSSANKDGKSNHCKVCANAKERDRYSSNKEAISAKILAKYHVDKTRHKKYYQENKLRIKKYATKYYEENKEDFLRRQHTRRANKINNSYEKYTNEDVFNRWGYDCHICGGAIDFDAPRAIRFAGWEYGLQMDHVIPLHKGGPDIVENVKPAHGICNLKKH